MVNSLLALVIFVVAVIWNTFSPSVCIFSLIFAVIFMSSLVGLEISESFPSLILVLVVVGGLFVLLSLMIFHYPFDYNFTSFSKIILLESISFLTVTCFVCTEHNESELSKSFCTDFLSQPWVGQCSLYLLLIIVLFLFLFVLDSMISDN